MLPHGLFAVQSVTVGLAERVTLRKRTEQNVALCVVFLFVFIVHNCFQTRHSVIVIPRYDAESSECSQCYLLSLMFSGFRVGARNDGYRVPRLKLIGTHNVAKQTTVSKLPPFGRVGVGVRFGRSGCEACQVRFSKRWSFSLQKVAYWNAKGGLSQCERPPFAKRADNALGVRG